MPDEKQRYSEQDAEEILRLAVRKSHMVGPVSRETLVSSAAELGISEEAVAEAEREYALVATENAERERFDKQTKSEFKGHLATYLIVNAGLLCIDFFSDGKLEWAYWSIIGWGMGVLFHAWSSLAKDSEDYEEEFQKWRAKRTGALPQDTEIQHGIRFQAGVGRRVSSRVKQRVRQRLRARLEALDNELDED